MADESRRKLTYDEPVDLVARLEARIVVQDNRIAERERQLAAADKNSRNSSKPPSSDLYGKFWCLVFQFPEDRQIWSRAQDRLQTRERLPSP